MRANVILMVAAIGSATVVCGQELTPAGKARMPVKDKPSKTLTPEEAEAARAKGAALRKAIAAKGGWVTAPMTGPSLKLIDATAKGWALPGLEQVKANLDRFGLCPSEAVRGGVPKDVLADGRAAARESCGAVMLVDGTEDAPILTAYPEERLALVNMTALCKGASGSGLRQDRVEKLTWRAIGHLVGCGAPDGYTCVMQPVRNLAELDAMPNKFIHPATFFKARTYFGMYGVTPARKGIYETAVQQGWAPPPTNDVQKAVWEKVHAIPNKPMKITFDPAAQKGKVTK